jgi:hypothetical protein
MSLARLVITAIRVESRSRSAVARFNASRVSVLLQGHAPQASRAGAGPGRSPRACGAFGAPTRAAAGHRHTSSWHPFSSTAKYPAGSARVKGRTIAGP